MGFKEGARLAQTTAQIKEQRAERLSQEEKDKIKMEIFKMGADIDKQQFEMQQEAHRMNMETAQIKSQQDMIDRRNALIEAAKQDRLNRNVFGDMTQYQMAGGGYDTGAMIENYLAQGGAQFLQPKDLMSMVKGLSPQEEKDYAWPRTKEEKIDWLRIQDKFKAKEKPPTKAQALSKIAQLTSSRERFNKTDKLDVIAQGLFPELKQAAQAGDKDAVAQAYNDAIEYYQQFVGGKPTDKRNKAISELKTQGFPVTEENIQFVINAMED